MNETSKSDPVRRRLGHFDFYLRGEGIDVGAGPDTLRLPEGTPGTVRSWDVADGDAQYLAGVPNASMDFVYSSHCLEHTRSVRETLFNWLRVLRPSGVLFVVVPDYTLYEGLLWPSRFNGDHRHSFSLDVTRGKVGRPDHFHIANDLAPLMVGMGAPLIEAAVEDDGYDYNAGGGGNQTLGIALAQIRIIARRLH